MEPHADKPGLRYAVADICRLDSLATTIAGQSAATSDFMEPIRRRERQSTTSRLLYGECRVAPRLASACEKAVRRVIFEPEAAVVREAFALAAKGWGDTRIAKDFQRPGISSPSRITAAGRARRERKNLERIEAGREPLPPKVFGGDIYCPTSRGVATAVARSMLSHARGRNLRLGYVCRNNRLSGSCANASSAPAAELHAPLKATYTQEAFEQSRRGARPSEGREGRARKG